MIDKQLQQSNQSLDNYIKKTTPQTIKYDLWDAAINQKKKTKSEFFYEKYRTFVTQPVFAVFISAFILISASFYLLSPVFLTSSSTMDTPIRQDQLMTDQNNISYSISYYPMDQNGQPNILTLFSEETPTSSSHVIQSQFVENVDTVHSLQSIPMAESQYLLLYMENMSLSHQQHSIFFFDKDSVIQLVDFIDKELSYDQGILTLSDSSSENESSALDTSNNDIDNSEQIILSLIQPGGTSLSANTLNVHVGEKFALLVNDTSFSSMLQFDPQELQMVSSDAQSADSNYLFEFTSEKVGTSKLHIRSYHGTTILNINTLPQDSASTSES